MKLNNILCRISFCSNYCIQVNMTWSFKWLMPLSFMIDSLQKNLCLASYECCIFWQKVNDVNYGMLTVYKTKFPRAKNPLAFHWFTSWTEKFVSSQDIICRIYFTISVFIYFNLDSFQLSTTMARRESRASRVRCSNQETPGTFYSLLPLEIRLLSGSTSSK